MSTPNVLFILADDLGWADVGYHGSYNRTPNIDRLARHGWDLDHHYVCPVCTPTRVSLLTGRQPARFGKVATWPTNAPVLPDRFRTIATMFREGGYATGLFGKWHLGSAPQFFPGHFGFDHSYGSLSGGVDPYTHLYKEGPYSRGWHRNGHLLDEQGHATDLITDEAIRWTSSQTAPWFAYVPYTAVHIPINAPEPWVDSYHDRPADPDPIRDRSLRLYGAYTSHMDHAIGRLVESLKTTRQLENTIIIFASDNGASLKDVSADVAKYPGYHEPLHSVGQNTPLRGGKTDLYEGGIRTPALLHWASHLQPHTLRHPISIADWMPTFSDMLGLTPDPDWDGHSLWPTITHAAPLPTRDFHWNTRDRHFAIRSGDWKLIHRPEHTTPTELFNLATDPREQTDLSLAEPTRVTTLLAKIESNRNRDHTHLRPVDPDLPHQSAGNDP